MNPKFLHAHLTADAAVTALVGKRVYPSDRLPQNVTLPAISFFDFSGQEMMNLNAPDNLVNTKTQLSCWDRTVKGVEALSVLVRASVNGLRGSLGGLAVQGVFIVDRRGSFEKESRLYRVDFDLSIWHPE